MFTRLLRRRPSPAMIVALAALFAGLGGTAWAATGSLVNIADGTNASNLAKVDATGALQTRGASWQTAPPNPFFRHAYVEPNAATTLIGATTSWVALTRMVLMNYYDQTAGAAVDIRLAEWGGTASTCDGSGGALPVAVYDVGAGQSLSDTMPSPLVLKPLSPGHVWCLVATASVQGSPGSFYLPEASFSGLRRVRHAAAGRTGDGARPEARLTRAASALRPCRIPVRRCRVGRRAAASTTRAAVPS
jgi:hypothetical protein